MNSTLIRYKNTKEILINLKGTSWFEMEKIDTDYKITNLNYNLG